MRIFGAVLATAAIVAVALPALSQSCAATGEYCVNTSPNVDGRDSSGQGPVACLARNQNPPEREVEYDFYISYAGFSPFYYCSAYFTCAEVQGMSQTVYQALCP